MFTLFIAAGKIDKSEILKCFDLTKVEFINNSNSESEYKEKRYSFHGNLDDLAIAAAKLDRQIEVCKTSGFRLNYALMLCGARMTLTTVNGTHISNE